LYSPSKPNPALYDAVQNGDISLQKPQEFKGDLTQWGQGQWRAETKSSCTDCIILGTLPLYFAAEDSPLMTERSKTIYFEVRVGAMGGNRGGQEAGIAIGFCAKPYPSWRLPGWQRASLGVHGDDGRRFVNDPDGGLGFTRPFKPGETVGIGVTFSIPPDADTHGKAHAEVFLTRDGKRDEGWQVNEERDRESDSVLGLEGELDLYAAMGMFGAVEFEVKFAPAGWLYQP
jgi:SPRY domain